MPEMPSGDRKSAAWGVVAVILGGGAFATWIAAASPGSTFPLWLPWPLGALAVAATFLCFRPLRRKHLTEGASNGAGELTPVSASAKRSAGVALTTERVDFRLLLLLRNVSSRAAEYSVQVVAFRDPLGRAIQQQHWTVPARDDSSTSPKRVLAGQTLILDFACYIPDSVTKEIATGNSDAAHWLFSASPNPIEVRYYNLRSSSDLIEQRFRLTLRVMCANTGIYTDYELAIGVRDDEPICEAVGGQ